MRYYSNANTARGDIAIVEMIQLGAVPFFAMLQMQKSVNSSVATDELRKSVNLAVATAKLGSNTITASINHLDIPILLTSARW